MTPWFAKALAVLLFTNFVVFAQQGPPLPDNGRYGDHPPYEAEGPSGHEPPPMAPNRPPMERLTHAPPGKWWTNPETAQRLALTADQQRKLDALFQQNRLKLIDLSATLQKQEAILEPLLQADRPDTQRILAQIDRIAEARADLEKANGRFLLSMRTMLTTEQWRKLQSERIPPAGPHF